MVFPSPIILSHHFWGWIVWNHGTLKFDARYCAIIIFPISVKSALSPISGQTCVPLLTSTWNTYCLNKSILHVSCLIMFNLIFPYVVGICLTHISLIFPIYISDICLYFFGHVPLSLKSSPHRVHRCTTAAAVFLGLVVLSVGQRHLGPFGHDFVTKIWGNIMLTYVNSKLLNYTCKR